MFAMFYFVFKVVSSIKGVIYNTTFPYSGTVRRHEKCLTFSRTIIHNNKTVATQRIILSGDIETKLKPTMKHLRFVHPKTQAMSSNFDEFYVTL